MNFSNNPEVKNGDAKSPKDSQDINNVDVCVPDTSFLVKGIYFLACLFIMSVESDAFPFVSVLVCSFVNPSS